VIRPMAIVAAIPAIWMLIQLMPMQKIGLAHPVWKSASAALEHPLPGSISIDPGATLISLVRYISAGSIAFIAAAVAVNRRRAQTVLFSLMLATTLVALISIVGWTELFAFIRNNRSTQIEAAMADCAGLGMIFAIAAALHTTEQNKSQQGKDVS